MPRAHQQRTLAAGSRDRSLGARRQQQHGQVQLVWRGALGGYADQPRHRVGRGAGHKGGAAAHARCGVQRDAQCLGGRQLLALRAVAREGAAGLRGREGKQRSSTLGDPLLSTGVAP